MRQNAKRNRWLDSARGRASAELDPTRPSWTGLDRRWLRIDTGWTDHDWAKLTLAELACAGPTWAGLG
eukprot:7851068-Pyramimonas_sp.AAC.1